jgi:hypothetical protein
MANNHNTDKRNRWARSLPFDRIGPRTWDKLQMRSMLVGKYWKTVAHKEDKVPEFTDRPLR